MSRRASAVRSLTVVLGLVLGAVHLGAQTAVLPEPVQARIAAIEPKVVAWRRDIHAHPELGNREFRTAKLVADHLKSLGIAVQTGVAHTGVVGLLQGGKPGPVVLLRADMDGLPVTERAKLPFASKARATFNGAEVGVMHACGHDTHVAIMMGVAEVLAGMKSDLPGTVKFVFQPAEEGPPEGEKGGAELMVAEGVLGNPAVDAAFSLHINARKELGQIFYRPGGQHASSDDFRIVVKGRQTHGAYPWNGADPIVAAAHIVTALQAIVSREMELIESASVVTVGKIAGGVRANIIPEQVEMIGTIRALDSEDRKHLHASVRRVATNVAQGLGVTAEVQIPVTTAYPVTYNDEKLTAAMLPALQAAAGADKVHIVPAWTGSDDFAFIADKVPSLYIQLGARPVNVKEKEAADHHTPDFLIDDSGLDVGVRALTAMTLHYMKANLHQRR